MTPAQKFKCCNRWLGCILLLMLASGIQLEATSGAYPWSVWMHISLGIVLTALAAYHIFLHYRHCNWFARFARNPNTLTRILWWVFLLTAASGIAATAIWLNGNTHSHLGAVHGKIGFLMVTAGLIHASRYLRKNHRRA